MSRRDYKEFAAGECYHIFNRGNNRVELFRDQSDYDFFLDRLSEALYPTVENVDGLFCRRFDANHYRRKQLPANSFDLLAYCLMPNHFHLLLHQNTDLPISTLMCNFTSGYSKYFNKKYERVGSLFQDQFKSTHIENNSQLLHVSAYAHLNPMFAKLCNVAEEYKYSSYGEYVGKNQKKVNICKIALISNQFPNAAAYRSFVEESAELIGRNKDLRRLLEG